MTKLSQKSGLPLHRLLAALVVREKDRAVGQAIQSDALQLVVGKRRLRRDQTHTLRYEHKGFFPTALS